MKFQKFAVLAVLCFFLGSFWAFGQTPVLPKQDAKALKSLVKWRPGLKIDPKVAESLVQTILKDREDLSAMFPKKDFVGMATRLGDRGTVLLTPGYDQVLGNLSGEFWKESWKEGATLEIRTVTIYITDIGGQQTIKKMWRDPTTNQLTLRDITYDLAAFVTQEFHVIEGGAASHNATTSGSQVYRHQTGCIWE